MYAITRGRNRTYEEWIDQGISEHNKLIPIECRNGVQSQTIHATGNRSELGILWSDPGDPVKVRHRLYDVTREPEIDGHGSETIHEPPHPGNRPAIDDAVGLSMEGSVEGDSCQVGGPDGLGRIDEEPSG